MQSVDVAGAGSQSRFATSVGQPTRTWAQAPNNLSIVGYGNIGLVMETVLRRRTGPIQYAAPKMIRRQTVRATSTRMLSDVHNC
jgi:hypothetical protein